MADIYCPRCAEPWDMDELHDAPNGQTYDEARRRFTQDGCGVFDSKCEPNGSEVAMASRAVMDLSPHADDWASDMRDFVDMMVLDRCTK